MLSATTRGRGDVDYFVGVSDEGAWLVDMVFDTRRNRLYVTTSGGKIERYSFDAGENLTPINVGGFLRGIDIDPTNRFLLVAQAETGDGTGKFHRIDIEDGTVVDISYPRSEPSEVGGSDVRILGNNRALVTTVFSGSGSTPIREIDLLTNSIRIRTDAGTIRGGSPVFRLSDRSRAFMGSKVYYSQSDTFESTPTPSRSLPTINRDGTLFAETTSNGWVEVFRLSYSPPSAVQLQKFRTNHSTFAFDPYGERFYVHSEFGSKIEAYSTKNWNLEFELEIGQYLESDRPMLVSPDGTKVAVSTRPRWPSDTKHLGVIVFSVPPPRQDAVDRIVLDTSSNLEWVIRPAVMRDAYYDVLGSSDLMTWSIVGSFFGSSPYPVRSDGRDAYYWRLQRR